MITSDALWIFQCEPGPLKLWLFGLKYILQLREHTFENIPLKMSTSFSLLEEPIRPKPPILTLEILYVLEGVKNPGVPQGLGNACPAPRSR